VSIILLVCFFKIICLGLFLFQNFETKQINKIIIVHLEKKGSLVHIAPAPDPRKGHLYVFNN
jgi:hypothetical protein